MIVPKIVSSFTATGIEVIDVTPEDNLASSTNYSTGVVNTNYSRADLVSVGIQVIIDKCYKDLIVLTQEVTDTYEASLAALDLEKFNDAVYQIVFCLLFDEANHTVHAVKGDIILGVNPGDKAELLKNTVLLIDGQLYDIDTDVDTGHNNKIALMQPFSGESGNYSVLHGYRQNTALLIIEKVKSCVYKKIANISCKCGTSSVEELYMNYKSILANFDLKNYGKTIDLIRFANTVCSDPKVKNCACSC